MTRELAAHFPHEMCILHRTIILIFGGPTCILVSHNALLLRYLWPAHPLLAAWCGLRVALCVVRPYLWAHVLRTYSAARRQPTPALVAQAFIAAQDEPRIRLNARLGVSFIGWLCCSSAYLIWRGFAAEGRTSAEEMLWTHIKLNFWSLLFQVRACAHTGLRRGLRALFAHGPSLRVRPPPPVCAMEQKILSIIIFFYLISSDRVTRSLLPETLDAYSTVETLTADDVAKAGSGSLAAAAAAPDARRVLCTTECIICVRDFAEGERVRWLRCPHAFHVECIDEWALRHKNACPLCQSRIGPPEPSLAELLGQEAAHPHAE